ncbi:hypothetical protein [Brevibacillus fortis]|uniref:Uncharacterized protein n=1 Tax=Brevibacillus fortis TaxID=2126352 RepID=A0A2P7UFV7_9BACL|nr:hypothetical protein [Brevibacillus fortis]PSJ85862.1 hypothetical protein C7R93_29195 [Brevibacillus fortis]
MTNWKNIKINGVIDIDKCVAEFRINETRSGRTPSGRFKVKIFEEQDGDFYGITNIGVKRLDNEPLGLGTGKSIEEALKNTVDNFVQEMNFKGQLTDDDFEWAELDDF